MRPPIYHLSTVTAEDSNDDTSAALLAVRATVNLPGLPFDHVACVDTGRDSIREYLTLGYLVALPQSQQHACDSVEPVPE